MRLHVLTTGGTIDKQYTVAGLLETGPSVVAEILRRAQVAFEVTIDCVLTKDSLDMVAEDRDTLRRRVEASPCRHILITHGTDTMPVTAEHLLGVEGKVVVLTGAMQPARMVATDAHFNVGLAVGVLQCAPDGVYLAMNGRVFPAGHVRKDRERGRFVQAPGADGEQS